MNALGLDFEKEKPDGEIHICVSLRGLNRLESLDLQVKHNTFTHFHGEQPRPRFLFVCFF